MSALDGNEMSAGLSLILASTSDSRRMFAGSDSNLTFEHVGTERRAVLISLVSIAPVESGAIRA